MEESMADNNTADGEETRALIPTREQIVDFYGDAILAAQTDDETIYVPLRPICDALGLGWSGQYERLKRDPVLSEMRRGVRVTRTPGTGGGTQEMIALPLKILPGWLFGISAARVRPELRDKILRYQRECYDVLWNAFKADVLPTPLPLASNLSGARLALEMAEAVASLARQQLALEERVSTIADYLRGYIPTTDRRLHEHDQRLTSLELQLAAGATITEAQAAEIALAVKNVGQALAAGGDRNGYARVYSELYRRFRVSSYKNLPAARYQEVLDWLSGWYDELQHQASGPPAGPG